MGPDTDSHQSYTKDKNPRGNAPKTWLIVIGSLFLGLLVGLGLWMVVFHPAKEPEKDVVQTRPAGADEAPAAGPRLRSNKLADNERKADLNSLSVVVETYYAVNSYYPSLQQLNDVQLMTETYSSMRKAYLADPGNPDMYHLVDAPTIGMYSYETKSKDGGSCSGTTCERYILTAILSDGTKYTKQSPE